MISANPHNPENYLKSAKYWKDEEINKDYSGHIGELIEDYSKYFSKNRKYSKNWFNGIETFLNGLNASFFDKAKKYQAIHIDLLPFATVSPFKTIADKLMEIDGLPEFINEHVRELIDIIKPKLIIVNGGYKL